MCVLKLSEGFQNEFIKCIYFFLIKVKKFHISKNVKILMIN